MAIWNNTHIGPLNAVELQRELERLGQLGYELVNAYQGRTGDHFAALKRPMPETDAPADPSRVWAMPRVTENQE